MANNLRHSFFSGFITPVWGRIRLLLVSLFSFCLFGLSGLAHSEQLSFNKHKHDNKTDFHYQWLDNNRQKQKLSFTIDNKTLYSRFRNFKAYQSNSLQRVMLVEMEKQAAQLKDQNLEVEFTNRPDTIEIVVRGPNNALVNQTLKQLTALQSQIETDYLQSHYYNRITNQYGQTGIKPDHVRIANESSGDLAPIAQAILDRQPALQGRDLTDFILGFIQSIPYSTLENRRETNGAGFSTPLRLLNNNQGDCDSKVTLMASLYRAIYPTSTSAIIYLPEHALIGIHTGYRDTDRRVKLADRDFILAEPTGPGMIPFAEIAESSEYFINGRQFSFELF